MTEKFLSQVQLAEMVFIRTVHGVTLRDKMRSCEKPWMFSHLSSE